MSLIQQGMSFLASMLAGAAGVVGGVRYAIKGGATLTGVTAWVGRTVFHQEAQGKGPFIVFGERDYLIPVASLPGVPQRGDQITETINGAPLVFEVTAPEKEPPWRYSDQTRTIYRIHCKRAS